MSQPSESRRRFVNFLLGGGLIGWLGSVLYPVFSFLKPPEITEAGVGSVSAGMASDIPFNSGQIVRYGRSPVLLVRREDGAFRAFGATCTHLDCIVQYRDDLRHIWCACHNGHYDLQGRNISGPPPRPLTEFDVNVVNDEVLVSRRESSV
ncbi:MAG TPA: Rieske (2Fe-2S) protein [Rhodothermales bacterium]|nr:Rieske (2Fe-2S) protein [Rhodothermales bacterium]